MTIYTNSFYPQYNVTASPPFIRNGNGSRPVERAHTDPQTVVQDGPRIRFKKRIIICCDGTWEDGLVESEKQKYTNILRLARAIEHTDERFNPPIPQIVFYQSGVGTESLKALQILDGAVGASLGDKVQEAYGFLAHNYQPGDEIYLFGFSRGAYTARMVAALIGKIGVLDRTDMDHFADIFVAYQKRGKATDEKEKQELDEQLRPWTQHNSPGKLRADSDQDSFSIHCVGVFDTVGSLGLPEEITMKPNRVKTLFGFSDRHLGEHIARAYQALALNEMRKDFDCAKFEQTEGGRRKKQVLKQCWFAGCHADVGGGYDEHDLSDLTLFWMAANIGDMLALDMNYLFSLPGPVAPWGEQATHDSATGIFKLADEIQRKLPVSTDQVTHETIHASVLHQHVPNPTLTENLKQNPKLVTPLLPLEEELRAVWRVSPEKAVAYQKSQQATSEKDDNDNNYHLIEALAKHALEDGKELSEDMFSIITHAKTMTRENGEIVYEDNWVGKIVRKVTTY